GLTDENREIDFHFIDDNGKKYRVEFKLMGKGDPESADAAIARQTDIFVADTLSDTNKAQFDGKGIHWVELRSEVGFRKLYTVLQEIGIPCQNFQGDLQTNLDRVIPQAFDEIAT
ncbi:MAG: CfrBI family restriction endonuclease, partial [Chloroflexota bacterium]